MGQRRQRFEGKLYIHISRLLDIWNDNNPFGRCGWIARWGGLLQAGSYMQFAYSDAQNCRNDS
jgi:hypothetical protein